MKESKSKIFVVLLIAVFVLFFLAGGQSIFFEKAEANFVKDFYNRFLRPFFLQNLNIFPSPADNFRLPDGYEKPASETETKDTTIRKRGPAPIIKYKPVIEYEQAVINAVEKAASAVVAIIISKDVPVLERCLYNPFGDFFEGGLRGEGFEIYVPCPSPSGRTERRRIGGGSGFIVSSDGLILTNRHVVSDASANYTVFTSDGKTYEAKVMALDETEDLAIIKIEAVGLPVAVLGNSDLVRLGQTAIAVGNALGEFKNTVSVGVISGIRRNISAVGPRQVESIEDVIQTDAAINIGNSGGPLVNLRGEVIGINTAVARGAENIGFAIPINKAKRVLESFKATGRIVVPFLGVSHSLTEQGVKVIKGEGFPAVWPGSAAEKAGIKEGDIILELNGHKIGENQSLASVIRKFQVGDRISVKIKRGEVILNLRAVLTEKPAM